MLMVGGSGVPHYDLDSCRVHVLAYSSDLCCLNLLINDSYYHTADRNFMFSQIFRAANYQYRLYVCMSNSLYQS